MQVTIRWSYDWISNEVYYKQALPTLPYWIDVPGQHTNYFVLESAHNEKSYLSNLTLFSSKDLQPLHQITTKKTGMKSFSADGNRVIVPSDIGAVDMQYSLRDIQSGLEIPFVSNSRMMNKGFSMGSIIGQRCMRSQIGLSSLHMGNFPQIEDVGQDCCHKSIAPEHGLVQGLVMVRHLV